MKQFFNKAIIFGIIFILIGLSYTNLAVKSFLPAIGLVMGIVLTSACHEPSIANQSKALSTKILGYAIILLGFGFNLNNIIKAGLAGLGYTVISIGFTLALGLIIGKMLKNEGKISTLISAGTAICGGSAIAAISPIIHAKHEQTAIAMGTVFLLNAIGLIIFPIIGHSLHLSQSQFGLLAALAIHDTSSVVGSCIGYGQNALMVGTTVKLVRALWIIPVSLVIAIVYSKINHKTANAGTTTKKPWFIAWFILSSLSVTVFPQLSTIGTELKHFGESLFIVALFLIGYNVSLTNLKAIGKNVFIQAVSLWVIISIAVITALKLGYLT